MVLSGKQLHKIMHQPAKYAEAVHLEYVSDQVPGITRIPHGKEFRFIFNGKTVKSKSELIRIRKLVIPPAWTNVWICRLPNGHLQVTGYDVRKRKQYKYHPSWNAFRNQTKFSRLLEFGKVLPHIRLQMEKHLSLPGMPREKVLATVVSLMERTTIRVGNSFYEKLYGSFGLTTLKDKHVAIAGTGVLFGFKGKKGVYHN
ncbi:MAG: DNA topoisomerase IB, partial [Chitinophagales bacterium]|nr:DNA topoisomerase IB [Chitinophagales bacterium]